MEAVSWRGDEASGGGGGGGDSSWVSGVVCCRRVVVVVLVRVERVLVFLVVVEVPVKDTGDDAWCLE